ncbi:MAG: hypothetical protein Q9226_004827 [Calogaya cf. arnoldii]
MQLVLFSLVLSTTIVISRCAFTDYVAPSVFVSSSSETSLSEVRGIHLDGLSDRIEPPVPTSQSEQTFVAATTGPQLTTKTNNHYLVSSLTSRAITLKTTTSGTQTSRSTAATGSGDKALTQPGPSPGIPQIRPPTVPPVPTMTMLSDQSSSSPAVNEVQSTQQPFSSAQTVLLQSSVLGAFENPDQSQTTIVVSSTTIQYHRETISSLATLTAPTTITTPIVATNRDGNLITPPAAAIVIGPGGTWWNGGIDGFHARGPACLWPFCLPKGGSKGQVGGTGSTNQDQNDDDDQKDDDRADKEDAKAHEDERGDNKEDEEKDEDKDDKDEDEDEDKDEDEDEGEDEDDGESTSSTSDRSSSTSSTSSSSVSSTGTAQPCSPDCTACKDDNAKKLKLPRRGLSHWAVQQRTAGKNKRTLREPANYASAEEFMFREYLHTFTRKLDIDDDRGGSSTGFMHQFSNIRFDAAVGGLYGCTSVIVGSEAGMWISHFWEVPSFRASVATHNGPRTDPDRANFEDHVLKQMRYGGPGIPGLQALTEEGAIFHQSQKPVWTIVTPRRADGVEGDVDYDEEVQLSRTC